MTVTTLALGGSLLDSTHLLQTFGLIGAAVIVFAECGLLVGFFLPGDSLLFTAGLLVSKGTLSAPLWLVIAVLFVAAFAGNECGYAIGYRSGPAVFRRTEGRFFRQEYVERSRAFFDRYGARALVLGRFVPIVRTFITVMAGVGRMPHRAYLLYNVIGAALWTVGVTLLGYFLGKVAFVSAHIELILIGIVVVSFIPVAVEFLRSRKRSAG
ncbi:MAG: DedA family protein [Actinomycetota bacterium]|nr:DedA family protein [Actinomycetota bacterium]